MFVALGAIVAIAVVVVATRPSEFRVSRRIAIAAPPSTVFAHVNDFHKWDAWNPWAKIDPAMRQRYEGAPTGAGAAYVWAGNSQVGEGRMTMTESVPSERITIQMEFMKPFAATSTAVFTFEPDGDRTIVTWSLEGRNNFVAKAMHLVVNMDRMIGGQFEKGLAQMKFVVEAAPKTHAVAAEIA